MKLQPGPFDLIKAGKKTVEVRLFDEKRKAVRVGDTIVFSRLPDLGQKIVVTVVHLANFATFQDLLAAYPAERFGVLEKEGLLSSLYTFYTPAEEARFGVVAIEVQPS